MHCKTKAEKKTEPCGLIAVNCLHLVKHPLSPRIVSTKPCLETFQDALHSFKICMHLYMVVDRPGSIGAGLNRSDFEEIIANTVATYIPQFEDEDR